MRITELVALDVRFPTSRTLAGSDAMNPDPDYSAAYAIMRTDDVDGREGHGLTFTIGRGTEICVRAIEALRPHVVGRDAEELFADMGGFWRRLTGDSQLRWIGPEKGAIHLATAAVVNAVWDLWAKVEGKPLWKLLADLSPAELVALVDFTYLTDAITPETAMVRLESLVATRGDREAELRRGGYPAYVTSVGWMGYEDEKIVRLAEDALAEGWTAFKMKVGRDPVEDRRRALLLRTTIGEGARLMMDANQVWDVGEAIKNIKGLAPFEPYWIEEPTEPRRRARPRRHRPCRRAHPGGDGRARPQPRDVQAASPGRRHRVLSDRRVPSGRVNEAVSVLLLAAAFAIPVCPHAGGVGLCEYVQHLSAFDYIAVVGVARQPDDRVRRSTSTSTSLTRRKSKAVDMCCRRCRATASKCGRSLSQSSPFRADRHGGRRDACCRAGRGPDV